jgi:hypothetical protein
MFNYLAKLASPAFFFLISIETYGIRSRFIRIKCPTPVSTLLFKISYIGMFNPMSLSLPQAT